MIIQYNCPACDKDWTDVYSCSVNGQCPHCGQRDVEPLDGLTLAGAFETVLGIARLANNAGPCPNHEREAVELITAFYLLNIKGN